MALKLVNQLNTIESMKQFSKPNYNLFMEECLTILKNICDENVTTMKKLVIFGPTSTKLLSPNFS